MDVKALARAAKKEEEAKKKEGMPAAKAERQKQPSKRWSKFVIGSGSKPLAKDQPTPVTNAVASTLTVASDGLASSSRAAIKLPEAAAPGNMDTAKQHLQGILKHQPSRSADQGSLGISCSALVWLVPPYFSPFARAKRVLFQSDCTIQICIQGEILK